MITFRARMYNVTSEEYLDNTPTEYSLGLYSGFDGGTSSNPSGTDVMLNRDGQTLTSIPASCFDFTRSTNIGTWFEYYAKKYYDETSAWPVLRLLTSNSIDSYYLEWNHSAPNGFYVKSDDAISRWNYSFQWSDSFNTQYTDERKYNLYYSTIFIKCSEISDLINSGTIKYAGAFRFNDTTGGIDTLVAVNTYEVSVTNEACIKYDAGIYLGRANSRPYYKRYNGTAIAMFLINATTTWKGPVLIAPYIGGAIPTGWSIAYLYGSSAANGPSGTFNYGGITWAQNSGGHIQTTDYDSANLPIFSFEDISGSMDKCGIVVGSNAEFLYMYLQGTFINQDVPPSDVDPTDIPPEDEPPVVIPPDNPDPYYDPTSDPTNPDYDPTKDPDPENPDYDPTVPHTAWRPPSTESAPTAPTLLPPQSVIQVPPSPPAFVTNNSMFTLYNPSGGDLNLLANFLWSPQWSIDTFKKILANPLDCILGLMVMPLLPATTSTKEMSVGNIATGITLNYFMNQFYDFDCGTFKIDEYYMSYLDYAPYTKVSIYLPYIGDQQLNTDEVMNSTVGVKYRFDLATGDCVAFISVDGNVLYSFSGNCAARLPLGGNNWSGMLPALAIGAAHAAPVAAGIPSLGVGAALAVTSMKQDISHTGSMSGSPGVMGIQTPYLIITRPRQALPLSQNSFTGYPSFITESLGSLSGYTEVEACHLEHVPCTGEELEEIERLLKEGVLF